MTGEMKKSVLNLDEKGSDRKQNMGKQKRSQGKNRDEKLPRAIVSVLWLAYPFSKP
jgi:hypothetical protein